MTTVDGAEAAETSRALGNAATLGMSLAASWSIAVALRLSLPRLLGPERFGQLHFSESFATTFMVFSSLGLDTYVRVNLSVAPERAGQFLGGALVLRAAAAGTLMAVMMLVLHLSGGQAAPASVVFLCGGAQAILTMNTLMCALMDSRGLTRRSAPLAVVSKTIYAAGVFATLALQAPLQAVPMCMMVAEGWRAAVLWRRLRPEFPGHWNVDVRAALAVVAMSAPFYLNQVLHSVYGELDVSFIAVGQGATEAGFYGAANNLAALALMMMPLLPAVLMPAGARAAARAPEQLERLMGAAWRFTLLASIPLAVFLSLGARDIVHIVFGPSYAPSALPLVVMAPTMVITYANTLAAIYLIQQKRTWFVTLTSVAGLLANIVLNLAFIPQFHAWLGPGGSGAGAATASLVTEALVLALMIGGGVRPPRNAGAAQALRTTLTTSAIAGSSFALSALEGWPVLFLIVGTYLVAGRFTGAIPRGSVVQLLRWFQQRRIAP